MAAVREAGVCLCVLCGLPAVGKSSLALELRGAAALLGWRFTVVSYDEFIPEQAFLTKPEEEDMGQMHTEWKLHRQAVLKCIKHFLKRPSTELPDRCKGINSVTWEKCIGHLLKPPSDTAPLVFLLDDNFYYPSMRYEVYQLARKYSLGFCQVYLHCDLETCISRNQERPKPVPTEVIEHMSKRLEPPNPQRNSWETNSIALDTTNSFSTRDIQKVMDLIKSTVNNPLSPIEDDTEQKEADRLKCATSVIHRADQVCRRLVSEAMTTARENHLPSENMRSLAAELNQSKARFLHDLRARLLQDLPFPVSEDVERVVTTAVEVFDRDKRDILSRIIKSNT